MAGHGFRRTNWDFFGVIAKDPLERASLDHVAERRGSAVRVHVADIFWSELRILDGCAHDAVSAVTGGGRLRDVIGVAGHAVTDDFGEDRCVAFLRMLERFED